MALEFLLLLFVTMGSKLILLFFLLRWIIRKTQLEEAREREEAWDSGWSTRLYDKV